MGREDCEERDLCRKPELNQTGKCGKKENDGKMKAEYVNKNKEGKRVRKNELGGGRRGVGGR